MSKQKILIIVTSHATMGEDGRATGVWFEELSTPYYVFVDSGKEVEIASIKGGAVPFDPHSIGPEGSRPASVERFMNDSRAMKHVQSAVALDHVNVDDYAAIFLPGGHGTMWDLPTSETLARLLSDAWRRGKVLAAVCHGPAGLLNVKDADGAPLLATRNVTGFSNSEEAAAGLTKVVPFLLEDRIRSLGARYVAASDFQPHAIRDGRLVTGQNPASSDEAARLALQAIA
ncbi:type 1 glutamine amidotransferase domain-containing protein [Caballeronia sp. LZ025]|uniref:type 1 glutamine amidotransferase domain-containing protein n=1 Tax=Caballeronia TaxID=1827195 RepID=UPI001FD491C2|nr:MULTISPECIES: type 1 glutamine amidotransferase domain-containing protein [Caballeronia]MDR5734011.1 type 1 glutamine amidotransferase domain-containing protein [Caballeronia sp. LZ025]